MWRHTYKKIFNHTYGTRDLKRCLAFCCNRCILTEGGTDKSHHRLNRPDKRLLDKPPGHMPPLIIKIKFVQGVLVRIFCTRPTQMGGRRCVTYFSGVPRCVTKCDRGRGSKLAKNSVT